MQKKVAFVEMFLEKDWCFNSFSLDTNKSIFLDQILLFSVIRADSEIQKEGTGRLS